MVFKWQKPFHLLNMLKSTLKYTIPYQQYLVMQFGDIYIYLAENPLTLHYLQDESFQKYRKQHVLAK